MDSSQLLERIAIISDQPALRRHRQRGRTDEQIKGFISYAEQIRLLTAERDGSAKTTKLLTEALGAPRPDLALASASAAPAPRGSRSAGSSSPSPHCLSGLPDQPPPHSLPPLHQPAPGPETRPSLSDLAAESPHIHAIRASMTTPKVASFNNAVSLYTASIHVACAAAFLAAHAACAPGADHGQADSAAAHAATLRLQASALHAALARVPRARPASLANLRSVRLQALILGVIGGASARDLPLPVPEPAPVTPGALVTFEHSSHMCMAALSAGWALPDALALWAPVHLGSFSASGRTFFPGPRTPQSLPDNWTDAEVRAITRAPGEAPLAVYIRHGRVIAIASGTSLRVRRGAARPPLISSRPPILHRPAPGRTGSAHHPQEPGHGPGRGTARMAHGTRIPRPPVQHHR